MVLCSKQGLPAWALWTLGADSLVGDGADLHIAGCVGHPGVPTTPRQGATLPAGCDNSGHCQMPLGGGKSVPSENHCFRAKARALLGRPLNPRTPATSSTPAWKANCRRSHRWSEDSRSDKRQTPGGPDPREMGGSPPSFQGLLLLPRPLPRCPASAPGAGRALAGLLLH